MIVPSTSAVVRHVRYSVPMVAAILGAAKKDVDRIVDENVLPAGLVRRASRAHAREISEMGIKLIALELGLKKEIPIKKTRCDLYKAVCLEPDLERIAASDLVTVELQKIMSEISDKIADYKTLMDMIVIDPETQRGEPVFKGTRITVRTIADMLARGETPEKLLKAYPTLRPEHLEAAPLYVRAIPRRGRPPLKFPEPVSTTRIPVQNL